MLPVLTLVRLADACGAKSIFPGGPSLYDNIPCDNGNVSINSVSDALVILANIFRILVAISGSLAVLIIIVAAIYYITSAGDPGRIKRAKDMMTNVAIGLILIIVSYAVVTFIAKGF
jgi:hypothetical protein